MKSTIRLFSLLILLSLFCSLCSCGMLRSIIPGSTTNTETETTYTATYDWGYGNQKTTVTYAPSEGYAPQENPTRPGYTFRYWTQNGNPVDGEIPKRFTGDITLVAAWEIVTYHLSYEGLTTEEAAAMPQTFTVEDETVIPNPSHTGYTFLGWNAELETDLVIPAGQTGDLILRANWASKTVQFSASANVNSIPVSAAYYDDVLKAGTVIHASAPVYQGGYEFDHWEINGNKVAETVIYTFPLAAASTQLTAVYKPLTASLPVQETPVAPNYNGIPEAGKAYLNQYVLYRGEQLPLVASTEEEFRKLVQYSALVGGVLELQAKGETTGKYELEIFIWGGLNDRLQNGEKILDSATGLISFPMNPKFGISYQNDAKGTKATISVSYNNGLNAKKSAQPTHTVPDRQGLLTSPGRTADFDAFPIDTLTETATVQTLYELEVLPFGKKPVFANTATEAEEIYNIARGILREIIDGRMSDYEKVKAIYSWIGLNLTYDTATAESAAGMTTTSYTLKGALKDRLAVCDGYASAFRLLCQIEGIRAEEVIGQFNESSDSSTGHAWNKVWIGGAIFGVDCTWARQKAGTNEIVTFSYLFLDEEGLLESGHLENAANGTYWVKDTANASILLPASVAIDAQNHTYMIQKQTDWLALVAYLELRDIGAAEFYLAGEVDTPPTLEYSVYTSGKYGYILFND